MPILVQISPLVRPMSDYEGIKKKKERRGNKLKVGFHYPNSRPEFTGRVDGPTRAVNSGSGNRTPVYKGRVHDDDTSMLYCLSLHYNSRITRRMEKIIETLQNSIELINTHIPADNKQRTHLCRRSGYGRLFPTHDRSKLPNALQWVYRRLSVESC